MSDIDAETDYGSLFDDCVGIEKSIDEWYCYTDEEEIEILNFFCTFKDTPYEQIIPFIMDDLRISDADLDIIKWLILLTNDTHFAKINMHKFSNDAKMIKHILSILSIDQEDLLSPRLGEMWNTESFDVILDYVEKNGNLEQFAEDFIATETLTLEFAKLFKNRRIVFKPSVYLRIEMPLYEVLGLKEDFRALWFAEDTYGLCELLKLDLTPTIMRGLEIIMSIGGKRCLNRYLYSYNTTTFGFFLNMYPPHEHFTPLLKLFSKYIDLNTNKEFFEFRKKQYQKFKKMLKKITHSKRRQIHCYTIRNTI